MSDSKNVNKAETLKKIYGSEKEGKYAQTLISKINDDLDLREKGSMVSNGMSYSQAYAYNQRKAVNYSPPREPQDDREVSFGIVHEKIVSFTALFLKYVFKRRINCYDDNGRVIKGLGEVYDLAIEYSHSMESFKKKIALIFWELFTQGNAFVLEDWEVRMQNNPKAFKKSEGGGKKEVTAETMDYTYEFLDELSYTKGEDFQTRRAVSKVLDGRKIIFGNPEVEELQEQPNITLEEDMTMVEAEALFGTLKRWEHVPKEATEIADVTGKSLTIFGTSRHKDPAKRALVHRVFNKEENKFNIFVNGVMMLPMDTPMSIFYPRMNYPISNVPAERLRGSIYARSIPAKTKFNADYVDWCLKMLSNKFEQGINPAILAKGKYTLTRDMFRGGQVTHGVSKEDFEKVDPENKGITSSEFNFTTMMKEIIESQTVNNSFSGELSGNATATEIATVDSNQNKKLAFLLDGLVGGFMDMAMRRAETIESKYTIKRKETMVDGKKLNVYQNFSINVSGIENVVEFNDEITSDEFPRKEKQEELFKKSFDDKKKGYPTEYHLVDPKMIREKRYHLDIEIVPELMKDSQLQMIQMFDEFTQVLNTFGRDDQGGTTNMDEMQKEYLEVSGRPDEFFTSKIYQELDEKTASVEQGGQAYNTGSFGKPTIKQALEAEVTK